ncbi:hypothetical protein KEJ15_06205 [Candidatus Bathyarchaeota archaeon]|nr:hypothetical protein [Candidatus Bathyarchaeota archaeon]
MNFPLDFWDTSLLTAVAAMVFLVTSELLSPYYGRVSIQINKKRLKYAAIAFSIVFLVAVAIRIVSIILAG